ncbi:MAG: metal-sensitive transcriptional regulator [Candidatus Spechtbacterales bacterium]|nr:metal-sensitive transcriptional regulator [Candidatus Spechtbacterales bacterium]
MKKETKKQVINRLKKIEGQVRGLQNMVEEEKYCVDIITQSSAIKKALTSVESLLLENHLSTHVAEQMKGGQTKKATEEVLKIYKLSQKK